ncbi:MAG: lumazine-binding protein [Mycolicibacterium sp.]|uniref:Rv0361 family membrane protein n=1 Tax=Mycolicibacterium sp. TaxID=2320850 RepID=UPI003D0E504C
MTEPAASSSGRSTAGPFLGALVIIVAVVIGVWLLNAFSSDEFVDDQQIGLSVVAQNDALQRQDYADFRAYTCPELHGAESEIVAGQRDSVAKRGERFVDGTTVVAVDGDRATAEVTYHFASDPDAKETVKMTFVRQDGTWKVCSTGPE